MHDVDEFVEEDDEMVLEVDEETGGAPAFLAYPVVCCLPALCTVLLRGDSDFLSRAIYHCTAWSASVVAVPAYWLYIHSSTQPLSPWSSHTPDPHFPLPPPIHLLHLPLSSTLTCIIAPTPTVEVLGQITALLPLAYGDRVYGVDNRENMLDYGILDFAGMSLLRTYRELQDRLCHTPHSFMPQMTEIIGVTVSGIVVDGRAISDFARGQTAGRPLHLQREMIPLPGMVTTTAMVQGREPAGTRWGFAQPELPEEPYHQATLLTPIRKSIKRTLKRILLTILPTDEASDDDNDDDDVEKDEEDEEHLCFGRPFCGITEFAATLPSSSPPPENVESLKDNIRETMTTVDQGMSVEEIERVVAQRVANAIEAIAIYETKTNMARKSISQTEQQECKVVENANNKRKWEGNHNEQCTVKGWNCKKVGHMTRECRNPTVARNQRTHTCYECGSLRHFKRIKGTTGGIAQSERTKVIKTKLEVGPFKVLERVRSVAYKLELPEELSRVHNTFHVSNLKKCYADEPLAIPLDGLHFDNKLQFVEEPVEIMDRDIKQLRHSRVPIVKVRWNSKRGPEFTWEREDQFKKKYPHLFTKTAPSSSAAS
ncbi:putative reverse transcriptase domain-containing protein [Tanacetum coccineum]